MKEQELAGFRFFRVLLPGFSEKMLLPRDFIKLIGNKKSTNTAIFLSPMGTVWQVNLYNETDGVYVGGRGWRDLTLANNLGNGYFLVLHYKGNMVFSFRAFNLSTREITYSSVTQKDERKEFMSNNVVDENSDIIGGLIETSRKKKKAEGLPHAHDQGSEIRRHRTLKERFEVTIKECNLSRRRLCVLIPSEFTKSCDLLTKVSKLTLRDPKGVVWPIGLFHSEGSHEVYISKGWSAFARANEVKIGDRCIFELLLKCQNQVTMSVKILNNSPSLRPMKPQEGCTASTKGKNLWSGASFEATITDYNVDRNYMHIPVEFTESNGLGKCSELALQDLQGRRWVVSVSHRYRGGRIKPDTGMSKGWKNFASIKRLRKGDRCVFEVASRGKKNMVVMQVRIVRRLKANE